MRITSLSLVFALLCLVEASTQLTKRNALRYINPLRRQAWSCHPGCRKFCLPSCKKSCCGSSAPDYNPAMFPQLIQYQSAITNPPPLPAACPAGCNPTCYPGCTSGCCLSQFPQDPQSYGLSPNPYDPYASTAACAPECAPQNTQDCCRSQALNLNLRPALAGAPIRAPHSKPAPASAPAPAAKPKPAPKHIAKKTDKKDGMICVRKCQNLCNPRCRFACCLPTHKHFDDDPKPKPKPVKHHDKPAPEVHHEQTHEKEEDDRENDIYVIRPVASPQRVPFPRLGGMSPTADPCEGQDPCTGPTTSPFGAMTDPFGSSTQPYGMTQNPYYSTQGYAPQAPLGSCPAPCSPTCAPSCAAPCCANQAVFMPPPPSQQPFYPATMNPPRAGSPGLNPIGQAPTTCPGTCPNPCAPACLATCCQGQSAPQVVHVPPASEQAASPALPPTICPGMCPNLCAPACQPNCCSGPQVIHVAPAQAGSPGLSPLGRATTCPGMCSNSCAPSCSPSCCGAPPTCPSANCPNTCAPSCTASCCAGSNVLPANWDRRNFIPRIWRKY